MAPVGGCRVDVLGKQHNNDDHHRSCHPIERNDANDPLHPKVGNGARLTKLVPACIDHDEAGYDEEQVHAKITGKQFVIEFHHLADQLCGKLMGNVTDYDTHDSNRTQ